MKKITLFLSFMLAFSSILSAQSTAEKEVAASITSLVKAMISVDDASLNALIAEQLSYGHSSGLVETKKEFIGQVTGRKTVYTDIIISNQVITVSGDVAICRNQSNMIMNVDNKPAELNLLVMMVWQKQNGQWKLLARQAVRKPETK